MATDEQKPSLAILQRCAEYIMDETAIARDALVDLLDDIHPDTPLQDRENLLTALQQMNLAWNAVEKHHKWIKQQRARTSVARAGSEPTVTPSPSE